MATNGHPMVTLRAIVMAIVVGSVTCDCPNASRAILTYNTGLTTTVHEYEQRKSAVPQAIKDQGQQVDFMCLQELWFEEDVKSVLDNVQSDFPYHWSTLHAAVGQLRGPPPSWSFWDAWKPVGWDTSPCNLWKLTRLTGCAAWHCYSSATQRQCVVENCRESLYALSPECRVCFSVASSGATDIAAKCANVFKEFNRASRPGLLILSKQPLQSVEYVNYHEGYPVLLERGYIKAEVQGGHTYVCTHLTSVFYLYFEVEMPQFSSFLEEQKAEILKLNMTLYNTPHFLIGDLNTGPERNVSGLPVLAGEAPENYDLLINDLRYQSPYMQNNGNCTYCPSENAVLQGGNVEYPDVAIDFVLTSPGVSADVTSAKRVLDRPDVMLSDHFGVQMDVCLP